MRTEYERFWEKVDRDPVSNCWNWTSTTRGKPGCRYGSFWDKGRFVAAHRFSYETYVDDIREETIDHICGNKLCVNPNHLQQLSNKENIAKSNSTPAINARKRHCKHGHALFGHNLYLRKEGGRTCKTCRNNSVAKHRALKKK